MRQVLRLLAGGLMLVGTLNRTAAWAEPLRYGALAFMVADGLLTLYQGVQRRRPHWTRESWRRFLLAMTIPAGALVMTVGMLYALDYRLAIVGAPRSPVRAMWVMGVLVCLLVGAISGAVFVGWLNEGDPARQFRWSPRRFWRRDA